MFLHGDSFKFSRDTSPEYDTFSYPSLVAIRAVEAGYGGQLACGIIFRHLSFWFDSFFFTADIHDLS